MTFALVALGRAIGFIRFRKSEPGSAIVKNVTTLDSLGRQIGTYVRLVDLESQIAAHADAPARRAGLFEWQPHADRAYYSPSFVQMLGWPATTSEEHGRFLRDAVHPDDLPAFTAAIQRHLQKDETLDIPCRLRDAHGRYRSFRLRAMAVRNASGDCIRVFGSIVRRGRPLHEAASRSCAPNERQTVDSAYAGTQPLEEDSQALLYALAHNVQAPLRAVHAATRELHDNLAARRLVEEVAISNRIRASLDRTLAHVERVVDLSVTGRGTLTPVAIDLSALVRATLSDTRPPWMAGAQVNVAPGIGANADPELLNTALRLLCEAGWSKVTRAREVRFDRIEGIDVGMYELTFEGGDPTVVSEQNAVPDAEDIAVAAAQRAIALHGGKVWIHCAQAEAVTFTFTVGSGVPETPGA